MSVEETELQDSCIEHCVKCSNFPISLGFDKEEEALDFDFDLDLDGAIDDAVKEAEDEIDKFADEFELDLGLDEGEQTPIFDPIAKKELVDHLLYELFPDFEKA